MKNKKSAYLAFFGKTVQNIVILQIQVLTYTKYLASKVYMLHTIISWKMWCFYLGLHV